MLKIGTIGTGKIVRSMLENMSKVSGIACEAVYSRKEETGLSLARDFGIQKVYTDLSELFLDPEIDFIYIASPNSLHYQQTKMALEYGKNVICEKPFTPTVTEADELISLAKEKHLFLFEAITTLYQPNYQLAREHLHELGDLKMVLGSFCQYSSRYDMLKAGELPNVFNPEFCGGSLMDLNLYNIYFLVGLFGRPDRVSYFAGKHENGIDTHGTLIMQYGSMICQCTAAKDSWCDNSVQILGDEGYISLAPFASTCQDFKLTSRSGENITQHQDEEAWFYEIQGIVDLVEKKDYTSCYENLDLSRIVIEVLEKARESAGIEFTTFRQGVPSAES